MRSEDFNWDLSDENSGILKWLSEPYYSNKDYEPLKMLAYFRLSSGTLYSSEVAWSRLPLMFLGAKYELFNPPKIPNRYPAFYKMRLSEMKNCNIKEGVNCIPYSLLILKEMDISLCKTLCFCFTIKDISFIIPCFEVVRCLFGKYTFILNRLLHSGGLSSYFENVYIDKHKLHFDFTEEFDPINLTQPALGELAWIIYTSEINQECEKIYNEFSENKRILAYLPSISGVKIACSGIRKENVVLVQHAELIDRLLSFTEITFTHPKKSQHINNGSSEKLTNKKFATAANEKIDDHLYSNNGNGRNIVLSIPHNTFLKLPPIKDLSNNKKISKDLSKATIILKRDQKNVTTNEPAIGGAAEKARLDSAWFSEALSDAPNGFKKFIYAINHLRMYPFNLCPNITYDNLNGNTPICFMKNEEHRKFALVTVPFRDKYISIIEACSADGLSLSTLIILSKSGTGNDVHQCVQVLIEDGSWLKEKLSDISGINYYALDHRKNRYYKHWAELIYEKITMLYNTF